MYVVCWFDGKSTQVETFVTLDEALGVLNRVSFVDGTAKMRYVDLLDHLNG